MKVLEEQIAERREERDDPTINEFEKLVGQYLKATPQHQSGQWRSLGGLDVSCRRKVRQITDYILITSACVFVIEAKCYEGKILAEGDARRTEWFMQKSTGAKIQIKSAFKRNPYDQLCSYVDSVRNKLNQIKVQSGIRIYGIIVFDLGADVSEVSRQIGGNYHIITLDKLISTIEEIETGCNNFLKEEIKLSPKQIEDLLCGRPLIKGIKSGLTKNKVNLVNQYGARAWGNY
ncbi:MAG: NERD domain-containing protein [Leptolyngbyaceae cyanobacterium SL_7_1]|nr:NERD domain-containing protein [Leptolyngbyaceae cyanobacterium SL_7_1]